MYTNQDVATRHVEYNSLSSTEKNYFKLNLRKPKWLVIGK